MDNEKELTELKSSLDFDNENILSLLDMPIENEKVDIPKPKKKKDILDWFKTDTTNTNSFLKL